MPRGRQKLFLIALRSIQAAEAGNAREPEPRADQHNSNTAQLTADRRDRPNAGEDAYADLLTDLRTMQATGTGQTGDEHRTAVRTRTFIRTIVIRGSACPAAAATPSGMTIPGTWQDPRIHLISATAGKSP
ncbi:hypothetical protein LSAT2_016877, partial [Lamellibrachia satsuma]